MSRRWIRFTALVGALILPFLTRAEQTPPGATTLPKGESPTDSAQVLVVNLKHTSSGEADRQLQQLIIGREGQDVTIVADSRTNSLILRGPQKQIQTVLNLLELIDGEPSERQPTLPQAARGPLNNFSVPQSSQHAPLSQQSANAEIALVSELAQLEQKTLDAAQTYRTAASASPVDSKQVDQLRQKLTTTVQQAFDKRQQLQHHEVVQLKERLQKVEQTIANRKERRNQIVDHRVAELIDEDRALQWDTTARGIVSGTAARQVLVPVTEEVVTGDGKRQLVTRFVPTQLPTWPPSVATAPVAAPAMLAPRTANAALPSAPPLPPTPVTAALPGLPGSLPSPVIVPGPPASATQLTVPDDRARPGFPTISSPAAATASSIRRELADAEHAFAQASSKLERLQELRAKNTISAAEFQGAHADLGHAQRRLDLARREFEAQARLLELDVAQAETRVAEVNGNLSDARELHSSGAATTSEVRKLQAEAEQAKLQLERAQTLLELHRNAANANEGPPEKATSDSAKINRS